MTKINGLPVGDAASPIRLTITARDIRDGAPLNPNACAIALAATRHIEGVTAAKAHLGRIYLMIRGKWRRFMTSGALGREICAFNRGGKFYPGEYDLLPIPAKNVIRRAKGAASSSSRKASSGRRRKPHTPRACATPRIQTNPQRKEG